MLSFSNFANQSVLAADLSNGNAGPLTVLIGHLVAAIVFSTVGIAILVTSYLVVKRMLPFSVTKEIEEDQNTALAIIIGAGIIGMSMIISASILG